MHFLKGNDFEKTGIQMNDRTDPKPQELSDAAGPAEDLRALAQSDIILYGLMAALTRFIPLPIIDDVAENSLQQIMIRKIAEAHELSVNDADLGILATHTPAGGLSPLKMTLYSAKQIAKKIAQKTIVIFAAKDTVDSFSLNYHIGYLLDYAFQEHWLGVRSALELRKAVDAVCSQIDTSPFSHVALKILKESTSVLGVAKDFLLKMFVSKAATGGPVPETPQEVPKEALDLVGKIQTALDLMPPEYFIEIRQRFARKLGMTTDS
jgi:hypothetical protein